MAWTWIAWPQWRLCFPHDFDFLAVCLSLRRDCLRSPLLHNSVPATELECTSGPQRESGDASPHGLSMQTDMVAPQETLPEDPPASVSKTGPKPGTHFSSVSIHIGKVVSLPSFKPVPQPQMFKSASVVFTDEKDFQSSPEEKKSDNRDWRMTQKLSKSSVSPEENLICLSEMKLGPLAPTGISVPHLPPTLQKKVQVEAGEREPQMSTFLPSCPQSSGIPGVAPLHQSLLRAWPEDRGTLVQKVRSSGLSPPLLSGFSPSSETALLMSTCPQVSRIPGLPSIERWSDQSVWDRRSLWRKQSERVEPFGSLTKDYTVAHTDIVQIMVAMLPTCPRQARISGFPSTCPPKAISCPSMAGLLPTCPTQTTVAGMPFRAKVVLSFDRWHILQKNIIHNPQRRNSVLAEEYLSPFCLWKARFPKEPNFVSLPLTPHQSPSMVDFVPACPRRSRVLGLPSKEFNSYRSKNMNTSLMEEGSNRGGDLVQGVSDKGVSNKRQISHMVAMLPSCPVTTGLLGMPSRSHKLLSYTGQVSMFRIEAQRPDAGSQTMSKARDYRPFSRAFKRPDETTQLVIQPSTSKDSETLRDMVDMSSSCPEKAAVFGLPSAPRREACMADLLPTCPGCTQICGLPSKVTQTFGGCKDWLASTKTPLGSPYIQRGIQLHNNGPSLDGSSIQAMTKMRPSYPMVACIPGLPSALMHTVGPKMVNSLHGFTRESRVPGMSLGPHTNQIKWTMERNTLPLPQEKSRFHLLDALMADEGGWSVEEKPSWGNQLSSVQKPDQSQTGPGTVIVSISPSCPNHSNITGIPSKESSYLLGVHQASMGDALGVPSKHIHCSEHGWPGEDSLRGMLETEVVGQQKREFIDQHLSQREHRHPQTLVLEGSVDVQQNAFSAHPLEMSVQVGQTCPGLTFVDISWKEEESVGKKTHSPLEMLTTEAGFWKSREKEDVALGCG